MRVGPYTQNNRSNRTGYIPTAAPASGRPGGTDSFEMPAMQLARKIKAEQGALYAGYFLHAVRPYIPPAEAIMIERTLDIHAEPDPRFNSPHNDKPQQQNAGGKNDMQMMQMLMSLMGNQNGGNGANGAKMDPMALLKMMGK